MMSALRNGRPVQDGMKGYRLHTHIINISHYLFLLALERLIYFYVCSQH